MIIEIPINKSKAIKRFALFVLLLVIFTFMIIQPQFFVKGNNFGLIKGTGYVGTLICIILTALVAQKVFNRKPGLIIDNEGIIDNSLGVVFNKVLWSEVKSITHLQNADQHYIALILKNPEQYIASEYHSLKRKMLELNYSTIKTPVNIAASRLKMNFDNLHALLLNTFEKNRLD